ncbi:conserved hypothetical protein, partial [Ricinus communis]
MLAAFQRPAIVAGLGAQAPGVRGFAALGVVAALHEALVALIREVGQRVLHPALAHQPPRQQLAQVVFHRDGRQAHRRPASRLPALLLLDCLGHGFGRGHGRRRRMGVHVGLQFIDGEHPLGHIGEVIVVTVHAEVAIAGLPRSLAGGAMELRQRLHVLAARERQHALFAHEQIGVARLQAGVVAREGLHGAGIGLHGGLVITPAQRQLGAHPPGKRRVLTARQRRRQFIAARAIGQCGHTISAVDLFQPAPLERIDQVHQDRARFERIAARRIGVPGRTAGGRSGI